MTTLAEKAQAAGYTWLALEHDDYGNAMRWPSFRDACRAHDLAPGVWFTEGGRIAEAPTDSHFAIAELESMGDYLGIVDAIANDWLPACPCAVVTNFTPLTDAQGVPLPQRAVPLIEAGFVCLTEAYLGDNPNATPDRLDFRATAQLGWPSSQPVFGLYNAPRSTYEPWADWPGQSDYLLENVL